MHSLNLNVPSLKGLLHLSPNQVELAWAWLGDPSPVPPPKELQDLTPLEWHLLDVLLRCLLEERELHLLH